MDSHAGLVELKLWRDLLIDVSVESPKLDTLGNYTKSI